MQYRITNTTNDRMKADLHRKATKLITEPFVNGRRLYPGESMIVPEAFMLKNEEMLKGWWQKGMIDVTPVGAETTAQQPTSTVSDPVGPSEEDRILAEMIAAEEAAKKVAPPAEAPPPAPVLVAETRTVEEKKGGPGKRSK